MIYMYMYGEEYSCSLDGEYILYADARSHAV